MIEWWKMLVGRLAVWACLLLLSPTALAQNHTCHKTETVEVRVAVPLQEPATFRSYTWCLKVPPRCSKYTVVMRERITYETEVRNYTVSECCEGYVSLYSVCVRECTACTNMLCNTQRNCTCTPGYIGPYCNQTCEAGKWGARCQEVCICRVGEDCDTVSGSCYPSTSTPASPTTSTSTTPAPLPTRSTHRPTKNTLTTPNTFVDLSLSNPTTSAEDLTDFNVLSRPRTNDSVRLVDNNDVNSLNPIGDFDYPILPTDSAVESFNYIQPDNEQTKNILENSLNVNSSVVNDRWMSELGAHSSVTLGSVLALLVLLVLTISGVIRCRNNKLVQQQLPITPEKSGLYLVARQSHYAVPGPPSFSFISGHVLEFVTDEDTYDQPRSVRCLSDNEPVYDELRY